MEQRPQRLGPAGPTEAEGAYVREALRRMYARLRSDDAVARACGDALDAATIYRVRTGRSAPTWATAERVALAWGCATTALLDGTALDPPARAARGVE